MRSFIILFIIVLIYSFLLFPCYSLDTVPEHRDSMLYSVDSEFTVPFFSLPFQKKSRSPYAVYDTSFFLNRKDSSDTAHSFADKYIVVPKERESFFFLQLLGEVFSHKNHSPMSAEDAWRLNSEKKENGNIGYDGIIEERKD